MTETYFDKWFKVFTEHLKGYHKYKGPIDSDQIEEDFFEEFYDDPEGGADEFYSEEIRQD